MLGPLIAAVAAFAAAAAPSTSSVDGVRVPRGFAVSVFAADVAEPTAMAWGPDGRLYVTEATGSVVAIRPRHRPVTVARGFGTPLGLAWRGRTLIVSETGRIERLELRGRRLIGRRTIVSGLPHGRHQQDNVVVGPRGRLYFGNGSTCDACRERDPRSATILSIWPDGRDLRIVARGLRNPFGLAFQPRTHRLYASVNGRDKLGDDEPAEMVVIVRRGADCGWPDCWPSAQQRRLVGDCTGVTPPAAYLEPHSSADGLAFWRGALFVAEWGQYDSDRHGRRVVRIVLGRDGRARKVSTFASGFDHPLALAVDRTGALLVSDWGRDKIYRIAHRPKRP
jgi:glucose/arabinose dehydrogenase